ncbi:MAG: branched-chain-amino-acid transaminase [Pirellulaceae bacterium]|nr:branched-chain-amino-acid transaminase [Pirellulaceae bacterium]
MALQIWINGEFFSKEDAKISVYDRGLLYGDGIFEGMRCYNGKVFRMEEHLKRLWESARSILLPIPIDIQSMAKAVNETLSTNKITDGYIRLIVTRGSGSLGLDPFETSNPQVIIIADHIALYPKELYEKGLEIITAATIRNHSAALNPRIKSLNYLNNIMAKIEGLKAGCQEALMLNHKGDIAECTGDNIFLVKEGHLYTPPADAGILDGITRKAAIEIANEVGIEVSEIALTRHDVFTADECFLTGSAAEIIPVVKVDDRPIGTGKPGPITQQLLSKFQELTRS